MLEAAASAPYAERAAPLPGWFDRALEGVWAGARRRTGAGARRASLARFVRRVEAIPLGDLGDAALRDRAEGLRARLLRDGVDAHAAEAFAVVREAAARQLGLRHHRVQVMGGAALLRGVLAEMATGEGKTLTAVLPAATFALAGRPVHVVTVNDYLASRDVDTLRPVYEALGLSVGCVVQGQSPAERRAAYACDVTYCTNKDLVFDYLRDRLAQGARRGASRRLAEAVTQPDPGRGGLYLRGLFVAIVDEADSVLIDEARTPLVLSGARPGDAAEDPALYAEALAMGASLRMGDFRRVGGGRRMELTECGRERLAALAKGRPGLWAARRAREELAEQALAALHLYERGTQYLVMDGKVQIVDEFTGRIMPDRSWERGLHQLIEQKEGCALTPQRHNLARITYQRFFRRYFHLCGMTGTAADASAELADVYGLDVVRVPTHRPARRVAMRPRLVASEAEKWAVVAARAGEESAAGRSVLIGTRSVAASEHVAELLQERGLAAVVLNASQTREEAEVIARAGMPGRITVSTNLAGRGTDIRLSREVREAGGLHVILTEHHESPRIDRQLFGRAARQGDPGSHEVVVAVSDDVFRRFAPGWAFRLARRRPGAMRAALVWWCQRAAEAQNARVRRQTLTNDERLASRLAFAGRGE